MNILITGGAGYVGSHAVHYLQQQGHEVWVYDNLYQGHAGAVPQGRLIEGDLHNGELLKKTLADKLIEAVMHFAAFSLVGESVQHPDKYYHNNVGGTLSLLNAMRAADVKKIVFSGTAAVYGIPDVSPIPEETPKAPINPYGATKLMMEQALADYAQAYGLGYAVLRYFNACGAAMNGSIGEDHTPESHLIPIILQTALGQREAITIFGSDYPTPDGTCVRDYIHVDDLASAHLLALKKIEPGQGSAMNLGTGHGYSVQEVVEACRRITGKPIKSVEGERRPGDPPELVADPTLANKVLGWRPKYSDLDTIIASAWKWHSSHPQGYGDR